MNRSELVSAMAEKSNLTKKDADKALTAFIDSVTEELQGDGKVQLVGFATFEVSKRSARSGKNPRTGDTISIPASTTLKVKAGKVLKEKLNGK